MFAAREVAQMFAADTSQARDFFFREGFLARLDGNHGLSSISSPYAIAETFVKNCAHHTNALNFHAIVLPFHSQRTLMSGKNCKRSGAKGLDQNSADPGKARAHNPAVPT